MSHYPHAIRLHSPWELAVIERAGRAAQVPTSNDTWLRADVPGDWGALLGREFHGTVRYRRRFGKPANLEPHERVWLVIEGADRHGIAALNGQPLGTIDGYCLESHWLVTERLQTRNELLVDVELSTTEPNERPRPGRDELPGGLAGVRMEIDGGACCSPWNVAAHFKEGRPWLEVSGTLEAPPDVRAMLTINGPLGELICRELRGGEALALSADVSPFVTASRPRAEFEARLIVGPSARWKSRCALAWRSIAYDAASGRLTIDGTHHHGPWPAFDASRSVADFPPLAVSTAVRTAAEYEQLNVSGTGVLQFLPPMWEYRLRRELARWPAIVGWVTCQSAPIDGAGRPTLSWEEASDARPPQ